MSDVKTKEMKNNLVFITCAKNVMMTIGSTTYWWIVVTLLMPFVTMTVSTKNPDLSIDSLMIKLCKCINLMNCSSANALYISTFSSQRIFFRNWPNSTFAKLRFQRRWDLKKRVHKSVDKKGNTVADLGKRLSLLQCLNWFFTLYFRCLHVLCYLVKSSSNCL